jgi:hypothetical protein
MGRHLARASTSSLLRLFPEINGGYFPNGPRITCTNNVSNLGLKACGNNRLDGVQHLILTTWKIHGRPWVKQRPDCKALRYVARREPKAIELPLGI